MLEVGVRSERQVVVDQMAGFETYLEGKRIRATVAMTEIAGRSGDSARYGGLFRTYQTLHAEKTAHGRLKGQERQTYNNVTTSLEMSLGFGDPGLPQVYVLWLNTEPVRNADSLTKAQK